MDQPYQIPFPKTVNDIKKPSQYLLFFQNWITSLDSTSRFTYFFDFTVFCLKQSINSYLKIKMLLLCIVLDKNGFEITGTNF